MIFYTHPAIKTYFLALCSRLIIVYYGHSPLKTTDLDQTLRYLMHDLDHSVLHLV